MQMSTMKTVRGDQGKRGLATSIQIWSDADYLQDERSARTHTKKYFYHRLVVSLSLL